MSKFLEIVENAKPEIDLDSITAAKRELQRMLIKAGFSAKASFSDNNLVVVLPDKRVVQLEVKNVEAAREEEAEDPTLNTVNAIKALTGLPDPGMKGYVPGSTSNKLRQAKNAMVDGLVKTANKFAANA